MKIIFQRSVLAVALMAKAVRGGHQSQPGEVGDGGPVKLGAVRVWSARDGCGLEGGCVDWLLDAHVMANKCKKANRKR